jgi:hypothetical protein
MIPLGRRSFQGIDDFFGYGEQDVYTCKMSRAHELCFMAFDALSWWFLEKHVNGKLTQPSSCNFYILICLIIGLASYLVLFDLVPCSQ